MTNRQRNVRKAIDWPFPPVTYDYERAGVGSRGPVIEVDAVEVKRILLHVKRTQEET